MRVERVARADLLVDPGVVVLVLPGGVEQDPVVEGGEDSRVAEIGHRIEAVLDSLRLWAAARSRNAVSVEGRARQRVSNRAQTAEIAGPHRRSRNIRLGLARRGGAPGFVRNQEEGPVVPIVEARQDERTAGGKTVAVVAPLGLRRREVRP